MTNINERMQISVFGVGTSLDQILIRSVQMAAEELKLTVEIKEIRDINLFVEKGLSAIPAMAIGDEVLVNGRVPSVTEIKSYLREETIPFDHVKPSLIF